MMRKPTDDIANWRLQQENTSKPFPYVFPQMPPRFRRCCALAKAVFLIQWGCFAAFGVCSMVLFIPVVIWGRNMDASLTLWRGEYETFRRMEEARRAGYTAKLQKVVSAVCLADVDIACNELKNARTHLEYAIREGGTLYVVEDARRMLAELMQKERVEGTDYGDGTIEN